MIAAKTRYARKAPTSLSEAGHASTLLVRKHVMGGSFNFRSASPELLRLVEAAYGGGAGHRLPGHSPELHVELDLAPEGSLAGDIVPACRIDLEGERLLGAIDGHNHVSVWPSARSARIVASTDMLRHAYNLRYELIEFAVFLLAARCQGLVPLHAACVGRDGRGLLLLGETGAGKSTLALNSLLAGLELLSEDAVFVQPDHMLATGVANFLHVRTDSLDDIDAPGARSWVAGSPIIRRRSGVQKFEADLRRAPQGLQCAKAPLQLVGAVILSRESATTRRALVTPASRQQALTCLAAGQAYAMTQPGWRPFQAWALDSRTHLLRRGAHPRDSVEALLRLLD